MSFKSLCLSYSGLLYFLVVYSCVSVVAFWWTVLYLLVLLPDDVMGNTVEFQVGVYIRDRTWEKLFFHSCSSWMTIYCQSLWLLCIESFTVANKTWSLLLVVSFGICCFEQAMIYIVGWTCFEFVVHGIYQPCSKWLMEFINIIARQFGEFEKLQVFD